MYEEYLRRNSIQAKSVGAKARIEATLQRLEKMKSPPKWLLASLQDIAERLDPIPHALAKWRNLAPDVPAYVRTAKETPDEA